LAQRLDFMAEFVIGALAMTLWLARYDPGLLKERMSGLFQKDQSVLGQGFSSVHHRRLV